MAKALRGTKNRKPMVATDRIGEASEIVALAAQGAAADNEPASGLAGTAGTADGDVLADDGDAAPQLGPRPALRGFIDRASWTTIEGWVWDPETPQERIRLEL